MPPSTFSCLFAFIYCILLENILLTLVPIISYIILSRGENKVSMKRTVLAAGLGAIVGYLAKQQIDQYQQTTPESVLKNAKESFKQQGPISGSWIYMNPEEVERNGLTYTAYRGGVTRNIDGQNKQYEFYADVDTGTIIDSSETL